MSGADYLRFLFETDFFTHLGALYNREAAIKAGFYTAEISSSDMDSLHASRARRRGLALEPDRR